MPRLPLFCLAALLAACGQTGPLYRPDAEIETPVEIRGPAANAPAAPAEAQATGKAPGAPAEPEESRPDEDDEPPGPIAP